MYEHNEYVYSPTKAAETITYIELIM